MNFDMVTIYKETYESIELLSKRPQKNPTTTWGRGIKNNSNDPYKAEREGLFGEVALRFLMGIPIDENELKENYKLFDVIDNGVKIQVKTVNPNYDDFLVRVSEADKTDSKIYVVFDLINDDRIEKNAKLKIRGWCYTDEVKKSPRRKTRVKCDDGWINYNVPKTILKPLKSLKSAI